MNKVWPIGDIIKGLVSKSKAISEIFKSILSFRIIREDEVARRRESAAGEEGTVQTNS